MKRKVKRSGKCFGYFLKLSKSTIKIPMNINEDLRIHSSYAYTARFINNMYFIATKNGLEVYNIEE